MQRARPVVFILAAAIIPCSSSLGQSGPAEAPSGFDGLTNGVVDQARFESLRGVFEERETIDDGLGPVYNAQACAECHQNPTTGGASQVTELRAGRFDGTRFIEHPGGSLINDRSIHADYQERVLPGDNVRTFRTSSGTLGDLINGGSFAVPGSLGSKVIHPFSDFLLHNVGTSCSGPGRATSGARSEPRARDGAARPPATRAPAGTRRRTGPSGRAAGPRP